MRADRLCAAIWKKDRGSLKTLSTSIGQIAAIPSEGHSPLVVFLHGIQGTKEIFRALLQEDFIKRHGTLVIDLPGFGDSSAQRDFDYSISSFAGCLEEILRSYQGDIVFVGHSLGGMIATRLLDSDITVRGVVSLEGNLKLADCGATKEIAALSEGEFVETYLPKLIDELSRSSEASAPVRLSALRKADPHALYQTSRAIVAESASEVLFDLLAKSSCPALLLVGAKSSFSTTAVPGNTQTVMIPNASHFLLQDNYSAVVTAMERFFNSL